MILRTYLPYKSTRQYVDRGMAKWMGFFISEHSTALSDMGQEINLNEAFDQEQIALIIGQIYVHQVKVYLYLKGSRQPMLGTVKDLVNGLIYFETQKNIERVLLEEVVNIEIWEDTDEQG